jgi:hypothetical protein
MRHSKVISDYLDPLGLRFPAAEFVGGILTLTGKKGYKADQEAKSPKHRIWVWVKFESK